MKEYVGRFPVNKGLTRALNCEGWVIYRDPEYGLYAYNEEMDIEVNLMYWNATVDYTKTEQGIKMLEDWRITISRAIEEEDKTSDDVINVRR